MGIYIHLYPWARMKITISVSCVLLVLYSTMAFTNAYSPAQPSRKYYLVETVVENDSAPGLEEMKLYNENDSAPGLVPEIIDLNEMNLDNQRENDSAPGYEEMKLDRRRGTFSPWGGK